MSSIYKSDKMRYGKTMFLKDHGLRFVWLLRKCQESKNPIWRIARSRMSKKYGLEIVNGGGIAPGLYLGHPYNITVNPAAKIGSNVNLHKGVTIGQENRGSRKGAPTIGESVWIGANSSVVGSVVIGNDVLIAPNSYVNCNVPDHSIVLGNPCKIIYKKNATKDYVNRKVFIDETIKAKSS